MTELERLAKFTIDQGDEWWELEHCVNASLHCCKHKYIENHRDFYTSPVYQVFNSTGKRICATLSYTEALAIYNSIK